MGAECQILIERCTMEVRMYSAVAAAWPDSYLPVG